VQKLLRHFGSSELVRNASEDDLARVVGRAAARRLTAFYAAKAGVASSPDRQPVGQ
jgi:hypothetical protein